MHGKKYVHLTSNNVAKYKQYYYVMLNDANIKKSECERMLKDLENEIISIEKQIYEIDIQLKDIYNEDSKLEVDIYNREYNLNKLVKEEYDEEKDKLFFSERQGKLENSINKLKIAKNILNKKRKLLIEKKKLLKNKKKNIKKDIRIINTNIKRSNKNIISISDTLQTIDEASINGVFYLASSKVKPKILEMKKKN